LHGGNARGAEPDCALGSRRDEEEHEVDGDEGADHKGDELGAAAHYTQANEDKHLDHRHVLRGEQRADVLDERGGGHVSAPSCFCGVTPELD